MANLPLQDCVIALGVQFLFLGCVNSLSSLSIEQPSGESTITIVCFDSIVYVKPAMGSS